MNLSNWLPYDDNLDLESRKEISNLIRTFLYIIPGISIVLAAMDFTLGLTDIALVTLTVPLFCGISLMALNRGYINLSMIIIITILIASTTGICIIGYRIHEIGIILFPVLVLFSSLVMNVRGVAITTIIVILCIAVLVFGEAFGIFPPNNTPRAKWADLVVVLTVIVLHIFTTYSFSNITKNNLKRATDELNVQKRYKADIAQNLEEKSELLRMVHHRVKNNLLLINSLIELETYGQSGAKNQLQEITDSIHTIARAHDPLYHTEDYKKVAIKLYLEKLIAAFTQSAGFSRVEIDVSDKFIFHETALLLGIITQKILSSINNSQGLELTVALKISGKKSSLVVKSMNKEKLVIEETSLVNLLASELHGKLEISNNEIRISFQAEEVDA
ncbi:MAG: histidine kinase dimerization/phosphoacceptor domain -containing protein [Ekhidna sp.]|uniref:histidine kinase dimerization/phosphoacceptor domain -containing protein n=1 Tax=Ekhidna sp. TaxID=2608089 RepID=UPI0032EB9F46